MADDNRSGKMQPRPEWLTVVKELVTAGIGVAIIWVTLSVALQAFRTRGDGPQWATAPGATAPQSFDPFQRGKDILLLLLPLAGAIVGYYTGRVVADRTIDQANATADQATSTATAAVRERNEAIVETRVAVRNALAAIEPPTGTLEGVRARPAPEDIARARIQLIELLERLQFRA